jgi:hypothetical protein
MLVKRVCGCRSCGKVVRVWGVDEDLLDDPKVLKSESFIPSSLPLDDMSNSHHISIPTSSLPSLSLPYVIAAHLVQFPWTLTDSEDDQLAYAPPTYPFSML